jgi:adenine-specific DNA methylase
MFNARQLLSLGVLMERIKKVATDEARHALATVFSDCLRYQNMLCRYDEYALKCQDIFAVHGFPVALVQCENNVVGIPSVGAGGFSHFVEKYDRAKEYCEQPFETIRTGKTKKIVPIIGERIEAALVKKPSELRGGRRVLLKAGSIEDVAFAEGAFDAVFTDPPYYDNVQYAELMDFCHCWLRLLLNGEFKQFAETSTRSLRELTGNKTTGKDLAHFTEGLSAVFVRAARGLRPGGPLVFTYHHNDVRAYVPVVVALLDAGLTCTATLPCPAEMTASLHINGTRSSVMDSIIVARRLAELPKRLRLGKSFLRRWLENDRKALAAGGVKTTQGDLYCLALGHLARVAVSSLQQEWDATKPVSVKMEAVKATLEKLVKTAELETLIGGVLSLTIPLDESDKVAQPSLFDQVL